MQLKVNLALALSSVVLAASAASCSVYDDKLVGPGGSGQGGDTPGNTGGGGSGGDGGAGGSTGGGGPGGNGGAGGDPQCSTPAQCPGEDTTCATRTCVGGVCGVDAAPEGTVVDPQVAGDCQVLRCDGAGAAVATPDDTDLPDDGNECTTDTCSQGTPVHTPQVDAACTQGGNYCNAAGDCVACTLGAHCPSGVCGAQFTCAAPACDDMVRNGMETDVDCGGPDCGPCATGQVCGANADCVGGLCAGTCQATCSDTMQNNGETDVDCGGANCSACAIGKRCASASDCVSGVCGSDGVCQPRVVISEARSRGLGGANDDFLEIYNPMSVPVVLDNQWKIEARGSDAQNYTTRWTGSGATLPPHGHFLIGGSAYTQMPTRDAALSSGLADAGSVRLVHANQVLDALCYYTTPATLTQLQNGVNFSCEQTPIQNPTGTSNVDRSLERMPGGAAGNGTDTNNNSADFAPREPAFPQNLASAPTP
ncbi:lamin tail domain-containing protein [Chondromyces crocatus]|uniref:LTD domain-containing protein n=1 Tax=Chondromyces crocatus TaxID=52 RepID=A0A0K1ER79_CHOCO|nr:lamin tail domain-containing protein [Chondromyces crocatus]AKT43152.1 uncharacterized protein CMC5_073820 [Chondromyces crocatus]